MKEPTDLIREYYSAFESKDRAALENLLADDFTFTSPEDDHISRKRYFEKCWPGSENLTEFDIKQILVDGNHAFVRYTARTTQGGIVGNTEFFTWENDKIKEVEVCFVTEDPDATSESEIRALLDETVTACRAKDVTALLRNYAPDVTAFDLVDPLRYCGTQSVARRAEEWFASFDGPIDYRLNDLCISTTDDTACCHSLNEVKGITTDGQPLEMWWHATVCCEKRDGQWLITHLHSSVPFDMKTAG